MNMNQYNSIILTSVKRNHSDI